MGTVYGLSFYREFMRLKESREAGEEICECVIVPTFGLLLIQYIYMTATMTYWFMYWTLTFLVPTVVVA